MRVSAESVAPTLFAAADRSIVFVWNDTLDADPVSDRSEYQVMPSTLNETPSA
jgi:hypothetical protein